ncbi:Flagellar P-ring protein, partial [Candidatus Magnetomorum sp. HK-1]
MSKLFIVIIFLLISTSAFTTTRIKDIAKLDGLRDNQLIGYGLVVGLSGTGDRRSNLAAQSICNFLKAYGVNLAAYDLKSRNIAAVCVTAKLPAFANNGDSIDVTVSSIGDAKDLQGGLLLLTPLKAANNKVYAVGQGPLSLGKNYSNDTKKYEKKNSTLARIPGGAIVEQNVTCQYLKDNKSFKLRLYKADFTTGHK